VDDVIHVKEQLDPKFEYLTRAPRADPDGNPGMIRFARKTREQYVMSEVDGKATGWRAFYQDGRWVEQIPEKKKPAAKKKPRKKAAKKKPAKKKAARASKAASGRKKAPAASKASPARKRKVAP
jgi:DNA topoisomerase-1